MARIYANENFPLPVVETLCRLGHDVLTTLDAGQAGQALPDETVLRFARSNLTHAQPKAFHPTARTRACPRRYHRLHG